MGALIFCLAVIVGAADADTYHIRCMDGTEARLRVHGIDAAETRRARCAAEKQAGLAAAKAARARFVGAPVALSPLYLDRYGRQVGDATLPGGASLADTLVRDGLARRWDYDGGDPKPDWCG